MSSNIGKRDITSGGYGRSVYSHKPSPIYKGFKIVSAPMTWHFDTTANLGSFAGR